MHESPSATFQQYPISRLALASALPQCALFANIMIIHYIHTTICFALRTQTSTYRQYYFPFIYVYYIIFAIHHPCLHRSLGVSNEWQSTVQYCHHHHHRSSQAAHRHFEFARQSSEQNPVCCLLFTTHLPASVPLHPIRYIEFCV